MRFVPTMFTVASLAIAGCAPSTEPESLETVTGAVDDGAVTTDYPEVVLLVAELPNSNGSITPRPCTGTVVAPRVVVTSSKCTEGTTRFRVASGAQYGERQYARGRVTFPVSSGTDRVDVSVVILNTPILLDVYPTLYGEPVGPNTWVVNVSRNDAPTQKDHFEEIWAARPRTVLRVDRDGLPVHYKSIARFEGEPADQGGAVFLQGTHDMIGVIGSFTSYPSPSPHKTYKQWIAPIDVSRAAIQKAIDDNQGADVATAECLFNYAEASWPITYPAPRPVTRHDSGFVYRYYPGTNVYLGLSDSDGYVYTLNANEENARPVRMVRASLYTAEIGCN